VDDGRRHAGDRRGAAGTANHLIVVAVIVFVDKPPV
jgi:hypothetical protein